MTQRVADRTLRRMTALFLAVLLALVPVSLQVVSLSRSLKLPAVLTCLIADSIILYSGSLLPGALGHYSTVPVGISTVLIALFVSGVVWKIFKTAPNLSAVAVERTNCESGAETQHYIWNLPTVILLIIGAMGLSPLAQYLLRLPEMFSSPDAGLNWDVVSYHLPALAEFLQAHSLWSVEGPCQSFSQGYELLGGLSVTFFHSPWSLVVANTVSIVLLVAATIYLAKQISRFLLAPFEGSVNEIVIYVMSIATWLLLFRNDVFAVGKNDIFEAATLLAAFGYLLDSMLQNTAGVRRLLLLILASIAYGLSIAAKSPSLMFMPLFFFMSGYRVPQRYQLLSADEKRAFAAAAEGHAVADAAGKSTFSSLSAFSTIAGSLIIGGFFEMRNMVVFHQLVAPDLAAETARMSLVHQWRQMALYNPLDRGALYAVIGLITAAFLFHCWKHKAKYTESAPMLAPLLCIFAFNALGLGAFAFMPTSVVIDSGGMNFQDRKIMAVYVVAGILVAIFSAVRVSKITAITIRPRFVLSGALVLSLIIAYVGLSESRPQLKGLPGYDRVKGLPRTEIYEWVQTLPPQRIYSAGLRPWGLYGRNLQNYVFYDLHSHILDSNGQMRVLAIMKQFHPDLILISVDPYSYTGPAHKPALVDWLRKQGCFTEVFNDDTVSGFRVNPGWEALLEHVGIPVEPVRMHG